MSVPPLLPLRFDEAFDATPNAYMILDRELRYVFANRAYLELTGSRLEDLVGRYVIARFPHDETNLANENARLLQRSLEKVLATRERDVIALIRYRVARSPGGPLEDRFWSATHIPLLENGEVAFILQHTVDVTELERLTAGATASGRIGTFAASLLGRAELVQQANVSLDEKVGRLRSMFEQAPGFTAVLKGPDHVFELTNAAYRHLIGERDVIGRPVREALPDIAGQGYFELLDRVYRTAEPFVGKRLPVSLRASPDGPLEERVLDFVYQPILDTSGGVGGIFVQGNDITEQARAEAERERLSEERRRLLDAEQAARREAERANRIKDEFLATVSHELRTPLTAILGWLELYHAAATNEATRTRAVDTITRNARALRQLVDDILDVSRIMNGKLELQVGAVHVAAAIEGAIESLRPAAIAKGVRLDASLDPDALVTGDAQRIQQVVWNLLSNAVKFTPRDGAVKVTTEHRGGAIAIVVADTGQGLTPDFLPHAFDRFRQADPGSTRLHGGLGLGLAIVKHLVELHRGSVHAESEGPGKGATFTVVLPNAISHGASTPPAAGLPIDCPAEVVGLDILVVEDEDDTRDLLEEIRAGFRAHLPKPLDVPELLAVIASVVVGRPRV